MKQSPTAKSAATVVSVCALPFLCGYAAPVTAGALSRSVDVAGTPAAIWSMIGPFCAIKDWHPAIGACSEDDRSPPTRTLVTKDGKARFAEMQTARNDAHHLYSYNFVSSPLPVTQYTATIEVVAKGAGISTVTWSGSYTPDPGKEQAANDALSAIYEAGLGAIKAKLAK